MEAGVDWRCGTMHPQPGQYTEDIVASYTDHFANGENPPAPIEWKTNWAPEAVWTLSRGVKPPVSSANRIMITLLCSL